MSSGVFSVGVSGEKGLKGGLFGLRIEEANDNEINLS